MNPQHNHSYIVEVGYGTILCKSRSVTSANATVKGLFNTAIRMIAVQLNQFSHFTNIDFDNKHFKVDLRGEVEELSPHLVTPEFLELKRIAKLRNEFLWALELRLQEGIYRLQDYYEPTLEAFLLSELTLCDPETGTYTDALHEYANISEVDVETVYQELTMKSRTAGIIRLRNKALYDKYVRKMNTASTKEELLIIMKGALDDAYSKQQL